MSKLPLLFIPIFFLLGTTIVLAHSGNETPHIIEMTDTEFFPKTLEITQNDTVIFKNVGNNDHWPASNIHPTHTLYPGSSIEKCGTTEEKNIFDACRGIKPKNEYSFTFTKVGTWRLHDHLYPALKGTIIVKEDPDAPAQEGTSTVEQKKEPNIFQKIKSRVVENWYWLTTFKGTKSVFKNEKRLTVYIKKYGVEQSIQHLNDLAPLFGDCHQEAHQVGRISYTLYSGDAFRKCSFASGCMSGCTHGAIETFFAEHREDFTENGKEKFRADVDNLCDKEPSLFFKEQCWHGVGHGVAALNDYDIPIALQYCDSLKPSEHKDCYEGVFMENVVGSISKNESNVGIENTTKHYSDYLSDDPLFPCTAMASKYQSACFYLQTSRMRYLYGPNFQKISALCDAIPSQKNRGWCFKSMGRDVASFEKENPRNAIAECRKAPDAKTQADCIDGFERAIFWDTNDASIALKFCKTLDNQNEKQSCYQTMSNRAKSIFLESGTFATFCSNVEESFKVPCLKAVEE